MGADDAFRDRATLPAQPAEADTVKGGRGPATEATDGSPRAIGPFDEPRERFETREELGRGGMGVVVEAFDRALKRPVAIKQMQSASNIDLARFEREAEITALLEHPGIVPIHDAGRSSDGLPYYVMRRIDGDPLDQVVAKKPYAERIAKMPNLLAACDAVGFAHARGVIHRDLKPSNILIGPFGETLVIDWGLARMLEETAEPEATRNSDANLTRVGSVAGTPGFMAPEQARGEKLDARADVYALGATMFYVLADSVAITGSGGTEMINRVAEGRRPEWHKLPEETPPELRAIIEKAMAFERDERYRDASELAADLRRYISGQFVRAYRYGLAEQIKVFVRRHRAAVAVGAIALAVIVVGAVFSIRRILDERDEARRARAVAETNQREAAKTRDQLLIQHALHLVDKEPASAIAALRRLPPESIEWPRAAAVSAAASAHGVPFGFSVPETKDGGLLAISFDSRSLAVMKAGTGTVNVIDLEGRRRTRFDVAPSAHDFDWIDSRTLIISDYGKVHIADRDRGIVRTIALPGERGAFYPSAAGRGFLLVDGRNVYVVDAATTSLGAPVIEDAIQVEALDDGRAVVAYRDRLALWSPTAPEQRIADGKAERVAIGRSRIAARIGADICVWTLGTEPTRELCESFKSYEMPVAFIDNMVVVAGINEVFALSGGQRIPISERTRIVYAQSTGIMFIAGDDRVQIYDGAGPFSFSIGTTRTHRIGMTPDGRFVIGLATTGDVLVWDLQQFRPRRYGTESRHKVFDVTARSIWVIDDAEGVFRIDRKTGESEHVLTGIGYIRAAVGADETWLVAGRLGPGTQMNDEVELKNTLVNLRTRIHVQGELGESFGFWREHALHVDRRGELFEISADGRSERVGTFTGSLQLLSTHVDWVAGVTATDVCRYRRTTRAVECIPNGGPIDTVAIDESGAAWIVRRGGLWRWAPGARDMTRSWPSLTFTHLTWAGRNLIAAGTGVLVKLYDPVALPVAVPPMLSYTVGSEHTIYGITPNHTVAAIDVATGVTTELPMQSGPLPSAAATALDGAVAIGSTRSQRTGRDVYLYVSNTPRDPVELRRWLATITNAMPIPGSDAVAWP